MLNSEIEIAALSLFSRDVTLDYRRTVCYLLYKTLERQSCAAQTSRIIQDISNTYSLNREDLKSAISALKSPFAFNAVRLWLARDKINQLCQLQSTPQASEWITALEAQYPHLSRMIQ